MPKRKESHRSLVTQFLANPISTGLCLDVNKFHYFVSSYE